MSAVVTRFIPRRRPDNECRGCGTVHDHPFDVNWPWCPECTLRWRMKLDVKDRRPMPPPTQRTHMMTLQEVARTLDKPRATVTREWLARPVGYVVSAYLLTMAGTVRGDT